MPSDVFQLIVAVLALVAGAASEELLPKLAGVGFPVLLTSVQFFAVRATLPLAVLFALAAGAAEDALSGLPPMTSASYFLVVAALVRWSETPRMATAVTYPCYQVWLSVWMAGLGGGVFMRILAAVPLGLATAVAVSLAMAWTWRKAAVDERG